MITTLAVQISEIIVGAVVAAVVVGGFGVYFLQKARAKKKGNSCHGGCGCCGYAAHCAARKRAENGAERGNN